MNKTHKLWTIDTFNEELSVVHILFQEALEKLYTMMGDNYYPSSLEMHRIGERVYVTLTKTEEKNK
jgi:hypothetical protein